MHQGRAGLWGSAARGPHTECRNGDIHQPLHAVSRFTHELPQGDLGGNRVRLCAPPCRRDPVPVPTC
jgi:hypothetical protein